MTRTSRCLRAGAAALALALATAVAAAQAPARSPQRAPASEQERKPERGLAGLPLYTSDGKAIGRALAMGLDENDKPVLVAEIERPLGLSPAPVAVPVDMFVRRDNRIVLTITEAEVYAKLEKAK
jgi:hypothetical protein